MDHQAMRNCCVASRRTLWLKCPQLLDSPLVIHSDIWAVEKEFVAFIHPSLWQENSPLSLGDQERVKPHV